MKLAPTSAFVTALALLSAAAFAQTQEATQPRASVAQPRPRPAATGAPATSAARPFAAAHPAPYQNSFPVHSFPTPQPAAAAEPGIRALRPSTSPYQNSFPTPHPAAARSSTGAPTGTTAPRATTAPAFATYGATSRAQTPTTGTAATPAHPSAIRSTTPAQPTAPAHAAAPAHTAAAPGTLSSAPKAAAEPSSAATAPPPQPGPGTLNRTTIVIDPAHGGADSGSRIADNLVEKDVTLALAFKLRSLLQARGFTIVLTRDADSGSEEQAPAPLSLDDRAGLANHQRAVACLLIHATGAGAGVHLYNSDLKAAPGEAPNLPWLSAQAAWVPQSAALADHISQALTRSSIPVVSSTASVRPVDSLTCPALVLELAPKAAADASSLTDDSYQHAVAQSVAGALVFWKDQAQPPKRLGASGAPLATSASPAPHHPAATHSVPSRPATTTATPNTTAAQPPAAPAVQHPKPAPRPRVLNPAAPPPEDRND